MTTSNGSLIDAGNSKEHFPPYTEDIITLQAGDKRFVITTSALTASANYFDAMFYGAASSALHKPHRTLDGAYIVLANPDIFTHIIDFALFETFPLFWRNRAFELGKYAQLLQQARYFGVTKLAEWIEGKGFEQAVTTNITYREIEQADLVDQVEKLQGGCTQSYGTYVNRRRVWKCPRGVTCHTGPPTGLEGGHICGRACMKAGEGEWEDIQVHMAVLTSQKTTVNFDALL